MAGRRTTQIPNHIKHLQRSLHGGWGWLGRVPGAALRQTVELCRLERRRQKGAHMGAPVARGGSAMARLNPLVRTPTGETVRVDYEGTVRERSQTGKTVERTAIGGAVGAIIGAIAGGGKGAAIGATVGAGAGAGAQVFTKGQQIKVPSETRIDFRLDQPFVVTYMPGQNTNPRRSIR